LFLQANYFIGIDILDKLKQQLNTEESPIGKAVLEQIITNNEIAAQEKVAICQDTGLAVVFVELGQEVAVVGGNFNEAVNRGVREAYVNGYLRKSVVADPLFQRRNSGDNTPAIIYTP
jgi:fumarate hydratase subunit alpha